MTWPPEINVAVIDAIFAVAGYVAKSAVDWWQRRRSERARALGKLYRLQSLLNASGALFKVQKEQVQILMTLLVKNHPDECESVAGYEEHDTMLWGF